MQEDLLGVGLVQWRKLVRLVSAAPERSIVIFYTNEWGSTDGIDFFCLNKRVLREYVSDHLQQMLQERALSLGRTG